MKAPPVLEQIEQAIRLKVEFSNIARVVAQFALDPTVKAVGDIEKYLRPRLANWVNEDAVTNSAYLTLLFEEIARTPPSTKPPPELGHKTEVAKCQRCGCESSQADGYENSGGLPLHLIAGNQICNECLCEVTAQERADGYGGGCCSPPVFLAPEVSLTGEGQAVAQILTALDVLPDASKTRVLRVVLGLFPMEIPDGGRVIYYRAGRAVDRGGADLIDRMATLHGYGDEDAP